MPIFDDKTNHQLYGAEDAENESPERLKEYFYRNRAYDNLICGLPIRILVGHKGVGKSALLKIAYLENEANNNLAVWLRPNDLENIATEKDMPFNALIEEWKKGIANAIYRKVIEKIEPEFVRPQESKLQGTITALFHTVDAYFKDKFANVRSELSGKIIDKYRQEKEIFVYLDDLDRGWEARPHDISRISALLNAIRDLVGHEKSLLFRLGLRSDVYFLVRTSDESTDKVESNLVWLTWQNHEILTLFAKRIETFYSRPFDENLIIQERQKEIARYLDPIIVKRFEGYGKWNNAPIHRIILSLIRQRPRDLVKLFYGASREAYKRKHETITTDDLKDTFETYSGERLQDIINEFKTEMKEIERLLYEMKPTKRERKTKDNFLFSGSDLLQKLKLIMEHGNFNFTNGREVSPKSLAQFLYKIDFITGRKDGDNKIVRRYFDQARHLQNQFVDFGYHWEIHPAYRWALQPGESQDIFRLLDLESSED